MTQVLRFFCLLLLMFRKDYKFLGTFISTQVFRTHHDINSVSPIFDNGHFSTEQF